MKIFLYLCALFIIIYACDAGTDARARTLELYSKTQKNINIIKLKVS